MDHPLKVAIPGNSFIGLVQMWVTPDRRRSVPRFVISFDSFSSVSIRSQQPLNELTHLASMAYGHLQNSFISFRLRTIRSERGVRERMNESETGRVIYEKV